MISALRGHGVPKSRQDLGALMRPGPWLYPEDQISDAPLRMLAAEITREKIFERLHDELPYQSTVETEVWKDMPDGSARIEQTIYVMREGHKKIVIGEGGRTIKAIGTAARKDIGEAAEQTVHLFLFVKVRENWARRSRTLSRDGARFSQALAAPAADACRALRSGRFTTDQDDRGIDAGTRRRRGASGRRGIWRRRRGAAGGETRPRASGGAASC